MLVPRALIPAAMLVAVLCGGCATNPVTGKTDVVTMSAEQEVAIGRDAHPKILQKYGRYDDEELQAYVSGIGQRIAAVSHRPDLQYTFTVLDTEDINAFALPGGYVYITRGIMAYLNSEAELVAVRRARGRSRHRAACRPAADWCDGDRCRRIADRHPHRERRPRERRQHGRLGAGERLRARHGTRGRRHRRPVPRPPRLRPRRDDRRGAPAEEPGDVRDPARAPGGPGAARLPRRLRDPPGQRHPAQGSRGGGPQDRHRGGEAGRPQGLSRPHQRPAVRAQPRPGGGARQPLLPRGHGLHDGLSHRLDHPEPADQGRRRSRRRKTRSSTSP